ncbi:TrbI/VirB10 family protein [Pseudoxanthomonas suwonensis]|uniref:Conjugal transfer protein TrbI n=1 Tax=Pseudoxanthomonas suwonensis TaxID=314722 RepID=A0A0E3UMR9_9GAMM|nr:TrbI/VirB10 family protein [Pseudoxanthomonas suwonensis]AKC86310.1 conjugal transfer protein TrbI [Pseudoxanthomonas suwonensis]
METQVAPKLPPESVALRAPPRPVTRLNRRMLIGLSGVLVLAVLGATWWSLHSSQRRAMDGPTELHNVERIARSEALDRLPEDYTQLPPPLVTVPETDEALPPDVPELGEPLPGDLGAPILRAEREAQGYAYGEDPAEAERLAQVKEAEEAMRSPVFFGGGARRSSRGVDGATPASPSASSKFDSLLAGLLPSQGEQAQASTTDDTRNRGELQPPASPYQVMAGTVIAAALVTGIRSDLPGEVIATVTEPVYDTATGRYLLIPQGSRLLGRYESDIGYGQRRVQVVWQRVILPDTSSLTLDGFVGADPAGYAGLEDGVDMHWRRLFAGAALTTLLGVGAELAAPENRDGNRIVYAGRDSAQEVISQVGQEVTRRNLDVQPTLTIRAGMPVRVLVGRDLVLRPYRPTDFRMGALR